MCPESEERDFVCLMRTWGPETGSEQQKSILCTKKKTKGQVGQHRGEAQVDKLLPKEGQVFPRSWSSQAKVNGGGRMSVTWGIKYCKSRKVKSKKRRGLGWTKNLILLLLGITGPLGQQQLEISTAATTCAVLRAKTRANSRRHFIVPGSYPTKPRARCTEAPRHLGM